MQQQLYITSIAAALVCALLHRTRHACDGTVLSSARLCNCCATMHGLVGKLRCTTSVATSARAHTVHIHAADVAVCVQYTGV
jgi:hypothetical protein